MKECKSEPTLGARSKSRATMQKLHSKRVSSGGSLEEEELMGTGRSENDDGAVKAAEVLEGARKGGDSSVITLDKLHELRLAFELADEDGGGGLDEEEFVKAFGHVLGAGLTNQELTNLFMKIDANSDGSVDWSEFTEYMLLENKGTELMQKAEPKCEYIEPQYYIGDDKSNYHGKPIVKARVLKHLSLYATCSEDGTVRLWNAQKGTHVRTITHKPEQPLAIKEADQKHNSDNGKGGKGKGKGKSSKSKRGETETTKERQTPARKPSCPLRSYVPTVAAWCVDCVYMAKSQKLAVASSDRTITFYDTSIGYECVGRIRPLISAPVCLDYYHGEFSDNREILICGDDCGYIHVWHLETNKWQFLDTGVDIDRRTEPPKGVHRYFRHRVHDDCIKQLQFNASIGNIISCSDDGKVQLTDLDKKRVIRSFCFHGKPVYAFVYISQVKLVASTGLDREILFWNPYTCAIAQEISGEDVIDSPIRKLELNAKEHQLISLSAKNIVRVWDLTTFSCVQCVTSLHVDTKSFTDMMFDPRNKQLVLTTRGLTIKQARKVEVAERKSHEGPVCAALYNKNFHQLVSAASFEVHVWDIYTGCLTFRFVDPHGASNLTSMCFDVGGRRLLTGAHDGTIKMWNFNNGACLGEFAKTRNGVKPRNISLSEEDTEVTSLICFTDYVEGNGYRVGHEYIVATGWDRRIFIFTEDKEKEFNEYDLTIPLPQHVEKAHQDDVNCVVYCGQGTIATAGDDGRILSWSLSSGFLKQRIGHSVTARKRLNPSLYKADKANDSMSFLKTKREQAEHKQDDDEESDYDEEDDDITRIRKNYRRQSLLNPYDLAEARKFKESVGIATTMKSKPVLKSKLELEKEILEKRCKISTPGSAREGKEKQCRLEYLEKQNERRAKKERMKNIPKPDKMAVENLIYLNRLKCLVSSGADGFIRFWDQANDGALLLEFDAGHNASESIIALAVDEDHNNFLFTGDTWGTVKIWDTRELLPAPKTNRCLFKIKLHNAWRAHKETVVNMQYVQWTEGLENPLDLLITTSADCSVILWTLDGVLIGMFGQEHPWTLINDITWMGRKRDIVDRARKLGQIIQNFHNFTQRMKKQIDLLEMHEDVTQKRKDDEEKDVEANFNILRIRAKNKYKFNYIKEIYETDHSIPKPEVSSQQLLLQTMSKMKRDPKPSEMPQKLSVRQSVAKSQIMQRLAVPTLQPISKPTKISDTFGGCIM